MPLPLYTVVDCTVTCLKLSFLIKDQYSIRAYSGIVFICGGQFSWVYSQIFHGPLGHFVRIELDLYRMRLPGCNFVGKGECQTHRPNDTSAPGHLGPRTPRPRRVGPNFETPRLKQKTSRLKQN